MNSNQKEAEKIAVASLLLISVGALSYLLDMSLSGNGRGVVEKLLLIYLVMTFCSSRRTYSLILLPLSILLGLYYPIAVNYGMPNYQFIVSLLATDSSEAKEFVGLLPPGDIVLGGVIVACAALTFWCVQRLRIHINKNKVAQLLFIAALLSQCDPWGFGDKLRSAVLDVKKRG